MSRDRRKRPTFLICEHCGKSTTVSNDAHKGALEAVSQEIAIPHPNTIKRALKRLGMYPVKKEGEKDDEETIRSSSTNNRKTNRSGRRHDHLEGQPSFGPVHSL